ncbi:MAG: hypothetical protein AAGJ37_14230 [Pseudomonadota bacterium]
MKNIILIASGIALLAGCGSVNQPVADLPLVDNASLYTLEQRTKAHKEALDFIDIGAINGDTLTLGSVDYSIGRTFYSASGNDCRFLSSTNKKLLYCLNSDNLGWQRIDDVIIESEVSD